MSIEEQMSFIDNIKKQHDDYIKEIENANSISLFVSVKSYDYNYLRDLMIRKQNPICFYFCKHNTRVLSNPGNFFVFFSTIP